MQGGRGSLVTETDGAGDVQGTEHLLGGGEEYAEGLGLELPEDKPEDDALDLSLVAVRSSLSLVYFISSLFLLGSVCCGVRRRC